MEGEERYKRRWRRKGVKRRRVNMRRGKKFRRSEERDRIEKATWGRGKEDEQGEGRGKNNRIIESEGEINKRYRRRWRGEDKKCWRRGNRRSWMRKTNGKDKRWRNDWWRGEGHKRRGETIGDRKAEGSGESIEKAGKEQRREWIIQGGEERSKRRGRRRGSRWKTVDMGRM